MSLKGLTRRSLFSLISLFLFFFLQVVIGITRAGFEISVIKSLEFWVDVAIQSGLNIMGMYNGQQMGIDMYLNNPEGAFRIALIEFTRVYEIIENSKLFSFFDKWLDFLKERKLRARKERHLTNNDVKQFEVLDLSLNELSNLENAWKRDWVGTPHEGKYKNNVTYFIGYSKEQINAIRECLDGTIKINSVPSSTFRNATAKYEKDMWDSLAQNSKRKGSIILAKYSYKIVTLVIMAIIFEGLRPASIIEDASVVLLNIGSQVITVAMAFMFGIQIGADTVKVDTQDIKYKTNVLKQFKEEVDLGIYKPKDIEEIAKEEYEKGVIQNGIEEKS